MPHSLPDGICRCGDTALLARPRRALLISRTPRRPVPATPWVRSVVESVRRSVATGEAIVTGIGRDPYELALREVRRRHGAAIVVLSDPPQDGVAAEWREWLPERHLLVWSARSADNPAAKPASRRRHDEVRLRERDTLIGRLADRAWEIAIRRGGIMAALAEELRRRGCAVEEGDRDGVGDRVLSNASDTSDLSDTSEMSVQSLNQPIRLRQQASAGQVTQSLDSFLAHYTREPDGAWPGETRGEYLDWLIDGPLDSRRGALDALKRILEEGRIRASGRLMPGREPMVSFTAASLEEVAQLRRFRASLHRWDFRPYGLAIRRDVLERLGARPVRYLPEAELKRLSPDDRLFAQKHEPPRTDWSAEAEWRLRGDLRLADLPDEALVVLAPTMKEAATLAIRRGLGVCVLGAEPPRPMHAAGGE